MITRLIGTTWTSLSAVHERLLNSLTYNCLITTTGIFILIWTVLCSGTLNWAPDKFEFKMKKKYTKIKFHFVVFCLAVCKEHNTTQTVSTKSFIWSNISITEIVAIKPMKSYKTKNISQKYQLESRRPQLIMRVKNMSTHGLGGEGSVQKMQVCCIYNWVACHAH